MASRLDGTTLKPDTAKARATVWEELAREWQMRQ